MKKHLKVEDSKFKDRDPYDNDRDDEYFVVVLENMSKEDAKLYSGCYGLEYKPARTGGYQLAGDEDSVREMLEDYIGRYDKIGKIMNEGYYIYSDDFKDSKSCYPSCDKKVKDNYNHFHEEKDDKWSVVFLPKDFDDQELFNSIANKYNCKFGHHKTPQVNRVIFYGEPENVFKAFKELNSKVNSKVNDFKKKVKDYSASKGMKQSALETAYDEAKKYYGDDFITIEALSEDSVGVVYHDSRISSDPYENENETEYAIDSEGHLLNILDGRRLITDSKKVKDSDYEFEYRDSYNNKDTFYNFKDLKEVVENSEKVAKKESLYFSWSVRVWASNGNASFDSADGDTLKDVENFIKDASKSKKVKDSKFNKEEVKEDIKRRFTLDELDQYSIKTLTFAYLMGMRPEDCEGMDVEPEFTEEQLDEYDEVYAIIREILHSMFPNFRDSKKVKDSQEDNYKALAEYLEWEGIIGYNFDIEYIWENNEAKIEDKWETFDNPYDALDAYLEWEGILGYTDAIYDILENGVESPYYNSMLEEKQSYEEE